MSLALAASSASWAGLFSGELTPADSRFVASADLINRHKADYSAFIDAWLVPLTKGESPRRHVAAQDAGELKLIDAAVKQTFEKFCAGNDRSFWEDPSQGESLIRYTCHEGGKEIAALEFVKRYTPSSSAELGSRYVRTFDFTTEATRKAAVPKLSPEEEAFKRLAASNGPSGWIETAGGWIRVLKFGTESRRSLLAVTGVEDFNDIRRIKFTPKTCTIFFTKGKYLSASRAELGEWIWRGEDKAFSATTWDSFPVVVQDKKLNESYTLLLKAEQIRAIEFDAVDESAPAAKVTMTLEKVSALRGAAYSNALRAAASKLGDASTPASLEGALHTLEAYRSARCGSLSEGVRELDDLLRCEQASSELRLLAKGSRPTAASTPLTNILLSAVTPP